MGLLFYQEVFELMVSGLPISGGLDFIDFDSKHSPHASISHFLKMREREVMNGAQGAHVIADSAFSSRETRDLIQMLGSDSHLHLTLSMSGSDSGLLDALALDMKVVLF